MSDLQYIVNQKIEKDGTSICEKCSHKFVCRAIDNQPCTECNQYSPGVRRGKWGKAYKSKIVVAKGYVSSCCDMWNERKSDFCPYCGAMMDGGDSDAKSV